MTPYVMGCSASRFGCCSTDSKVTVIKSGKIAPLNLENQIVDKDDTKANSYFSVTAGKNNDVVQGKALPKITLVATRRKEEMENRNGLKESPQILRDSNKLLSPKCEPNPQPIYRNTPTLTGAHMQRSSNKIQRNYNNKIIDDTGLTQRLIALATTHDKELKPKLDLKDSDYSDKSGCSEVSFSDSFGSSILEDIYFSSGDEWSPVVTPPIVGGPQPLPVRTHRGKMVIELSDVSVFPDINSTRMISEYSELDLVNRVEQEFTEPKVDLTVVGIKAALHDVSELKRDAEDIIKDLEKSKLISSVKRFSSDNKKTPMKLRSLKYGIEKSGVNMKSNNLSNKLRKRAQKISRRYKTNKKPRQTQNQDEDEIPMNKKCSNVEDITAENMWITQRSHPKVKKENEIHQYENLLEDLEIQAETIGTSSDHSNCPNVKYSTKTHNTGATSSTSDVKKTACSRHSSSSQNLHLQRKCTDYMHPKESKIHMEYGKKHSDKRPSTSKSNHVNSWSRFGATLSIK